MELKLLDVLLHQVAGCAHHHRTPHSVQVGQSHLLISYTHVIRRWVEVNVPGRKHPVNIFQETSVSSVLCWAVTGLHIS